MRFVSTRLHGVVDYLWGAALLLAPRLLRLPAGSAEARAAQVAGAGAIAYAALTDYELGLVPLLDMRQHLALDVAGGAALAASPWLLGFAARTRSPHLAFGLFAIGAGLLTRTRPLHGAARPAPKGPPSCAPAHPFRAGSGSPACPAGWRRGRCGSRPEPPLRPGITLSRAGR